uniref:Uncharacterized protein n=1 Tax=Anguilla anguilla TaxID=7936 RepID=A0A0E9T7K6_ANGAN
MKLVMRETHNPSLDLFGAI